MQDMSGWRRLLMAGIVSILAACGSKSPQEVEAERAKANAEWNSQVETAERARQSDVQRLVAEEVAAHEHEAAAADDRARELAESESNAEQARLLQLVREKVPNATFSDVHWNATRSALCGRVQDLPFIASGNQASVDSVAEDEHARFSTTAATVDCSP